MLAPVNSSAWQSITADSHSAERGLVCVCGGSRTDPPHPPAPRLQGLNGAASCCWQEEGAERSTHPASSRVTPVWHLKDFLASPFWHPCPLPPSPRIPQIRGRETPEKAVGLRARRASPSKNPCETGTGGWHGSPPGRGVGDSGRVPRGLVVGGMLQLGASGGREAAERLLEAGEGEEEDGGGIALPRSAWGGGTAAPGRGAPSGGDAGLGHCPSTLRAPLATARGERSPGAAPRTCRAPAALRRGAARGTPPGEAACWVPGDVALTCL